MNRQGLQITMRVLGVLWIASVGAQSHTAPTVPGANAPAQDASASAKALKLLEPQASPVGTVGQVFQMPEGDQEIITFDSLRYWKDSRWYVLGEWIGPDTIRWLGGQESRYRFPRPECSSPELVNHIARPEDFQAKAEEPKKKKALNREILHKGRWVAVEVSPNIMSENFVIRSPFFQNQPDCVAKIEFRYGWKGQKTPLKPILFLKPRDYFYGRNVLFYVPEKPERANIQLDLFLGYWLGTFPNAALSSSVAQDIAAGRRAALSAPSKSIFFVPAAVSRGEWLLPFFKRVGLSLSLEQSLKSFKGVPNQSVLVSDWGLGAFYQQIFPALDGLQFRLFMKYLEHLADQGTFYNTMVEANRQSKNFIFGTTLNYYFSRRWLLGTDFEYGLPNSMAGRGVTQAYLAYAGRLGYRLTTFMTILGEAGFRNYKAEGYQTEKILQSNLGIRLEL